MIFSVRLTDKEREKLEKIAKETDRSQGSVIRRLLELADCPEGRLLLGIRESVNPNATENS